MTRCGAVGECGANVHFRPDLWHSRHIFGRGDILGARAGFGASNVKLDPLAWLASERISRAFVGLAGAIRRGTRVPWPVWQSPYSLEVGGPDLIFA